ncbi:MAG: RNA polymerase sigma factor [Ignavibacteriae bacterium]|nr:MAG: RNA polymerase sigma factor [Ignavibacteriota bacterium]
MLAEPIKNNYNPELVLENSIKEAELVQKASNGDCQTFKELFEKYVNRIYAFCMRISSNPQVAEELTQDVFVKAWEKLDTFRGDSQFSTWLHSIAVNEFLMYKRTQKRFLQRVVQTDNINQYDISTERHEYHFNTNIDIENAISTLPEQAKIVFILHDVHGYQHKEIAEIADIEIGTSKAHLHRARKLLREELSK